MSLNEPNELISLTLTREQWREVMRAVETALDEGQAGDIDAFVEMIEQHVQAAACTCHS